MTQITCQHQNAEIDDNGWAFCPDCGKGRDPIDAQQDALKLSADLTAARAEIEALKTAYEMLDKPLMGEGITNLEILNTVLSDYRLMLDANTKGLVYQVIDPNAAYFLLEEMEAMLEQLRLARVSHASE